jgi:nucleoside-diphosphate-sugar epimerase
MKVACEQLVVGGARAALVVRPGLIVGPGDPTGRFGYWPERLATAAADGAAVLAPGDPADVVQVVDVRDLADWVVDSLEHDRVGTYDGVGVPVPIGGLLAELVAALAPDVTLRWVDAGTLTEHGVEPWAGEAAVPLWLPRPAYDGMLAHDPTPSIEAGLRLRPLAETAVDTLAWLRADPSAVRGGLTRQRELALLSGLTAPG